MFHPGPPVGHAVAQRSLFRRSVATAAWPWTVGQRGDGWAPLLHLDHLRQPLPLENVPTDELFFDTMQIFRPPRPRSGGRAGCPPRGGRGRKAQGINLSENASPV